jgi:hypothetical protein
MLEHLAHIPKIKGFNPTIYIGRDKDGNNLKDLFWQYPSRTVVDHSTHNPETKGLNPSTGIIRQCGCNPVAQW